MIKKVFEYIIMYKTNIIHYLRHRRLGLPFFSRIVLLPRPF